MVVQIYLSSTIPSGWGVEGGLEVVVVVGGGGLLGLQSEIASLPVFRSSGRQMNGTCP